MTQNTTSEMTVGTRVRVIHELPELNYDERGRYEVPVGTLGVVVESDLDSDYDSDLVAVKLDGLTAHYHDHHIPNGRIQLPRADFEVVTDEAPVDGSSISPLVADNPDVERGDEVVVVSFPERYTGDARRPQIDQYRGTRATAAYIDAAGELMAMLHGGDFDGQDWFVTEWTLPRPTPVTLPHPVSEYEPHSNPAVAYGDRVICDDISPGRLSMFVGKPCTVIVPGSKPLVRFDERHGYTRDEGMHDPDPVGESIAWYINSWHREKPTGVTESETADPVEARIAEEVRKAVELARFEEQRKVVEVAMREGKERAWCEELEAVLTRGLGYDLQRFQRTATGTITVEIKLVDVPVPLREGYADADAAMRLLRSHLGGRDLRGTGGGSWRVYNVTDADLELKNAEVAIE